MAEIALARALLLERVPQRATGIEAWSIERSSEANQDRTVGRRDESLVGGYVGERHRVESGRVGNADLK